MENDSVSDLAMQSRMVLGLIGKIAEQYHLRNMKDCLESLDRLEKELTELDNLFQAVKEEVLDRRDPHTN